MPSGRRKKRKSSGELYQIVHGKSVVAERQVESDGAAFDPAAISRDDAEEVVRRFRLLVASASADPSQAVSRLAIVTPD